MKKLVIAGGSGFLGNCLAEYYSKKGYKVVILSRKHQLDNEFIRFVSWDAATPGAWAAELEGADALINLAGKSVDCRYTEANKQEIYRSRIDSTNVLGKVVQGLSHPPKLWINAASATIYRHALDRPMDEETGELGDGFSVDVCRKWERTFEKANLKTTRKVILRIAIVLGNKGGALQPLVKLTRVGFGGKQGKGSQFFSWLHEEDFVRIVDHIVKNDHLSGVFNASSPNPISNEKVMKTLRRLLNRPIGLPMPKWLLELGAFIIRTETELILKSRRVVPKRLLQSGFKFEYPSIEQALGQLISEE